MFLQMFSQNKIHQKIKVANRLRRGLISWIYLFSYFIFFFTYSAHLFHVMLYAPKAAGCCCCQVIHPPPPLLPYHITAKLPLSCGMTWVARGLQSAYFLRMCFQSAWFWHWTVTKVFWNRKVVKLKVWCPKSSVLALKWSVCRIFYSVLKKCLKVQMHAWTLLSKYNMIHRYAIHPEVEGTGIY